MNIEYTKIGDYYMPNILPPKQVNIAELGKYGKLRLRYLKHNKTAEYTILLIDNKLQQHLVEIDEIANKRFNILMQQLAEKENVTEKMKAENQLKWVGLMNNIKNQAEEIILKELIYV